jgi:hypothetical protein
MAELKGPVCEQCGKQHRGYSDLNYLECSRCCKEVGSSKLRYPGCLCDECWEKQLSERDKKRRADARPGLIEVCYGVLSEPEVGWKDGGEGYAYRTSIKGLEVGDVVLVPRTWLSELRGGPKEQEATVVSTYSSYEGSVVQSFAWCQSVN